MPQRPSKKAKRQSNAKAGIVKGLMGGDKASQTKYEDKAARTILGKFEGRKSIDRN